MNMEKGDLLRDDEGRSFVEFDPSPKKDIMFLCCIVLGLVLTTVTEATSLFSIKDGSLVRIISVSTVFILIWISGTLILSHTGTTAGIWILLEKWLWRRSSERRSRFRRMYLEELTRRSDARANRGTFKALQGRDKFDLSEPDQVDWESFQKELEKLLSEFSARHDIAVSVEDEEPPKKARLLTTQARARAAKKEKSTQEYMP